MDIQQGDLVMAYGVEWVVVGIAPACLYLSATAANPLWAPHRFERHLVSHVWRAGEWQPVQGEGENGVAP